MKYIKAILIIVSILFSSQIFSQIDREILAFVDSTEIKINNGRKLLVKYIEEKNFDKARQVYDYLINIDGNNNCSAFYYDEELYVTAIINKWDRWIELATGVEKYNKTVCYNNVFNIEPSLYNFIKYNVGEIKNSTSQLEPEDKEIINIYLILLESGQVNESYNTALRSYKSTYAKSKYQKFMTLYLPGIQRKGSYGFVIGAGYIHPTYNLYHYFRPNTTFHMGMDFNVGKVYTSLYINGGSLYFDNELTVTSAGRFVDLERGNQFSYFEGGVAGGYFFVRNEKFHVAPYALIGGCSLESNLYRPELDMEDYEFEVFNSFICGLGVHTEFKFAGYDFSSRSVYGYEYRMKHHFSIKLDIGYNYITKHTNSVFAGDIIYIKPALVWGIGDF